MAHSLADDAVLAIGLLFGCVAWSAWAGLLLVRGWPIPWFSFWYNVPITLVFGAMAVHAAAAAVRLRTSRFLAEYAGVIAAWAVGGLVLYLRLVAKSIDVSGHMSWAVLLAAQCHLFRLPRWFTIVVWGVVAQVLLLKLFMLGGPSWRSGAIVGAALAAILWGVTRITARICQPRP